MRETHRLQTRGFDAAGRSPLKARHSTVAAACLLWLLGVGSTASLFGQVTKVDELKYPPLAELKVPQPTRLVLDNGLVLMLLEDHELPLVRASVLVHTGSRLEPADKIGLASITGSVMRTGGTQRMTGDQLDDYLEGKAAVIETSIGTSSGGASMSCLKKDFPDVLRVLSDVLRQPIFEEQKILVAKNARIAAIARQNDDPGGILSREFDKLIYGKDSPYSRVPTYDTINAITRADLVAWHARYYHPNRIILGLVGDFDTLQATDLIKQVFGDWKKGPEEKDPDVPLLKEAPPGVYQVEKADVTQSNIAIGHLGIKRDNPDFFAVTVLNDVLSGSFVSRLFLNVRSRKGLAYDVGGGVGAGWDHPGAFEMSMSTKTETTAAGIEALLEQAHGLTTNPPTEEEVSKAKASILNSFVFRSDSREKILGQQLTYEYYGYPLDWLTRYHQAVEKVTVDEVRAAAAKYIKPKEFAILVVGPPEGLDKPLGTFGKVTKLDITIPEPTQPKGPEASTETKARAAELIERALEGVGGAQSVDQLRTLDVTFSATATTPQGDFDIRSRMFTVFPDRYAQEITLPGGALTTVYTPSDAFMKTPGGVRPAPDNLKADWRKNLYRDTLGLLKSRNQPGFQAWTVGKGQAGGKEIELVHVEIDGDALTVGIEPESGRVLQIGYRGTDLTGAPGDVIVTQSDFKPADRLILPYASVATFNGQPMMSIKFEKIATNVPVDEKLFAKD
jgi:zinc protease